MILGQPTHTSLKLPELRYLNNIMHIVQIQLALYNSALTDVMTYAMSALASTDYIEPQPTYSKNILFPPALWRVKNFINVSNMYSLLVLQWICFEKTSSVFFLFFPFHFS
jgi:hypothetical protein